MTSEEFTEQKAYFKKLEKYYDKVHEDEDLRKLCECAKRENHTPKNYVPTDDEDEEIMEVGSVAKDTETEEDDELSSGEESETKTDASTTEQKQADAVKDIMPTTDNDSGPSVENESEESDEEQHVSSAGMPFKCSECAKIWKMKGALNCKQCSWCAKKAKERESKNIMPKNKDNTTSPSSEELDLENILNKIVDYANKHDGEEDTHIEQNKTAEDETENNVGEKTVDKSVSIEENEKKDIDNENDLNIDDKSVAGVDKMDYIEEKENKEINKEQKENTHAVVVRPCCVSLKKLDIGNNKQYTVQEKTKTNETEDQDQGDSVEQQPKKRRLLNGEMFLTSEKRFRILCPMLMTDTSAPKGNVPVIMAQSKLFIVTC